MSKKVISQIKLSDNLDDIFVIENDDKNSVLQGLLSSIEELNSKISSLEIVINNIKTQINYDENDHHTNDSSDDLLNP